MAPDPGLFGPDTVTWRMHADPLIGVAGLRALLLQTLHPVAMAGVAQNSTFREDAWGRLFRTAEYVGTVSYGPAEDAYAATARVRGIHRRIRGVDPHTGRAYRASDPDLLLWVHNCLVGSILDVTRRGGLRLTPEEADTYVAEQGLLAELIGVPGELVPGDVAELAAYFDEIRPQLHAGDEAREVARFILLPPMHIAVQVVTPARPAWASLAALAFSSLPGWARSTFALPTPPISDLATTVGLLSLRTALLAVPGVLRDGPHLRAARARLEQISA